MIKGNYSRAKFLVCGLCTLCKGNARTERT